MKTIVFENVTVTGTEIPSIERCDKKLSAEQVANILSKHGFIKQNLSDETLSNTTEN